MDCGRGREVLVAASSRRPGGPRRTPEKIPSTPGAVSVQETSPDAFGPGVNIVYL